VFDRTIKHNQLNDTQMLEVRTVVTDVPLVWAAVSLSVTLATLLTHSPDGATSMQPLLHYCSLLFSFRDAIRRTAFASLLMFIFRTIKHNQLNDTQISTYKSNSSLIRMLCDRLTWQWGLAPCNFRNQGLSSATFQPTWLTAYIKPASWEASGQRNGERCGSSRCFKTTSS